MKRYEELDVLGNGAFGMVTKARDRQSGDIVAVKQMKQRPPHSMSASS
jgi:protein kinase